MERHRRNNNRRNQRNNSNRNRRNNNNRNRSNNNRNWNNNNQQLRKRKPQKGNNRGPKNRPQKRKNLTSLKSIFSSGLTITNPSELLKKYKQEQLLKITDSIVPWDDSIILKDISLKAKGPAEDTIFSRNKGLWKNLRRGNTVVIIRGEKEVEETDKEGNHIKKIERDNKILIARKGMRKFFDLYPQYISLNLGEISKLEGEIGIKSIQEHRNYHNLMFADLENFFSRRMGSGIIYETSKANGENCQISWLEEKEAWVIASKNVSLLARTPDDIPLYDGSRFHFAKLIAEEWFNTIKKFKKTKMKNLKEYLATKTVVGEYTGNQDYQHLVKYEKQRLFFYAVVDKSGSLNCISPRDAFDDIKSLGLECVEVKEHGPFKNFQDFNNKLKELYTTVAGHSLEDGEEGSVLYISKRYNNDTESFVSLCKLKTVEYRIYRKLREKLRRFTERKGVSREEIQLKFLLEIKKLIGDIEMPNTMEYYTQFANSAFGFAEDYPTDSYLILKQFVTFLSIIEYCTVNNKKVHPGYFNKKTINSLLKLPWSKYKGAKKIANPKTEEAENQRKKVIVLVPISIPGIGKSHFYEHVVKPTAEKLGMHTRLVGSDKVRKEQMDKLRSKNSILTESELFNETRKSANAQFEREMIGALKEKDSGDVILFIDKNHPPNGVPKTIKSVKKYTKRDTDVRLIAVIPISKAKHTFKIGEVEHTIPFSLEIFINCLLGVQMRRDHPTLNGNGTESANIMLLFYNLFRDFQFNASTLTSLGFNGALQMDFFSEGKLAISDESRIALNAILQEMKIGGKGKDLHKLDSFLLTLQEYLLQQQDCRISTEVQTQKFENFLKNLPKKPPTPPAPTKKPVLKSKKAAVQESGSKYNLGEFLSGALEGNDELKIDYETNPAEEVKNKRIFRMKKLPIYLGIFVKDEDSTKSRVRNALKYVTAKIHTSYSNTLAETDFKEFNSEEFTKWKWPQSHHITTFFVGKEKAKTTNTLYKTFQKDVNFPFKFKHIVYIPGKIATAIVFIDREKVGIENEFPHMTLACGDSTPKYSNDILKATFGGVMKAKYELGLNLGEDKPLNLNVEINGQNEEIFLYELPEELYFSASTKAFTS